MCVGRRPRGMRISIVALAFIAGLLLSSSTASAAVFPGANGSIVFIRTLFEPNSTLELFRIEPDGSGEQRLTTNTVGEYDPAWSPDGSEIAFARFVCGPSFCVRRIFAMNPNGGGIRAVSSDEESRNDHFGPVWSPDGTRLAYVVRQNNSQLWVVRSDGGGSRPLSPISTYVFDPSWSPDGGLIAFTRQDGQDAEVWVVRPDGSGLRQLTNHADGGGLSPEWSPDGSRVAYLHADSFTSKHDVWLVDRDGSNDVNLTETDGVGEYGPTWSPDGLSLLYTRRISDGAGNDDVGNDVIRREVASGDETNLTNSPLTADGGASWSPDGSKILFHTAGQLSVMDASGTDVVPLGESEPGAGAANWQPVCTIIGTSAGESLVGTDQRDIICGGGGNDVILAGDGADIVFGGGGNDRLVGGPGSDTLVGQDGNDVIIPGSGDDLVVGAAGIDTVSFAGALLGISLSFATGRASGEGADTVVTVENATGSSKADSLSGNSRANVLRGGAASDRLFGARGNDLLLGGTGNDSLNGGRGTDTCRQGAGTGPRRSCEHG